MRPNKIERICQECGEHFLTWPFKLREGKGKFCSKPCHYASYEGSGLAKRFWEHIERGDSSKCWPYQGAKANGGYGEFMVRNKKTRAHRVAWELTNGRIPEGLIVLHSCDNPPCCNPGHLSVGTKKDNTQDMLNKGRGPKLKGENHPRAKLSQKDIDEIRCGLDGKFGTQQRLAQHFGVTSGTISSIKHGRIWKVDGR